MKIKIYTLTSDTDEGLHCELFPSYRRALERLIGMHNLDQDDTLEAQRLLEVECSDREGEGDLLEFLQLFRQSHLDSFNLSSEVIEVADYPEAADCPEA